MADKEQIEAVAIALAEALKAAEIRIEEARKALAQEEASYAALVRTRNILIHGPERATSPPGRQEELAVILEMHDTFQRHGTVTAARRKAILDTLAAINGTASPAQIAEQSLARFGVQLDKWALRDLLSDMTRDGAILKVGHGEYRPRIVYSKTLYAGVVPREGRLPCPAPVDCVADEEDDE